jgi:hypothetical protein
VEDPAAPAPEDYQFLYIFDHNAILENQKTNFSACQDSELFGVCNNFIPPRSGDEMKQKDDDCRLCGFNLPLVLY